MTGNKRRMTAICFIGAVVFLSAVTILGFFWQEAAIETDFSRKNLAPCARYLFGTDWMGRDMFIRTVTGLSMSIRIGLMFSSAAVHLVFEIVFPIGLELGK